MLQFLPIAILGATLLGLLASNLFQRGFRSSWALTTSGSALAFAGLIFLRLRLPQTTSFSAWWAGEGLVSSISFSLDEISWQIALVVGGLILALYLSEVDRAMSAPWLDWVVNLALGVACLFAVFSGDLLTLSFIWILVDAFTMIAIIRLVDKADERKDALAFLPTNITASFLLMAAWIFSGYAGQLSSLVAIVAASLRLGIFASTRATNMNEPLASYLRLLPIASVFVLLSRSFSLEGFPQTVVLILLLLPALLIAYQLNQQSAKLPGPSFERGFGILAIASAVIGQPIVALGFGLIALVSNNLFALARFASRWRWLGVAASVVLFSFLPFLSVSGNKESPVLFFVFLVIEAALLSGWARNALNEDFKSFTGEPWMRVIGALGLLVVPMIYVALAIGLAPSPSLEPEVGWLHATIVIVLSLGFFFAGRRAVSSFMVPTRLAGLVESVVSMRWIELTFESVFAALRWILRLISRVLEGQAGVLWALLLIVLLISLASQFALG
jgi:hypothetical protein